MVDDFLTLFGGSEAPVMTHMVESGELKLEDLKSLEEAIKQTEKKEVPK